LLLECLICGHLHDHWHGQAELLGGMQIDHQVEFGWLYHGNIGWLFTPGRRAWLASSPPVSPKVTGRQGSPASGQAIAPIAMLLRQIVGNCFSPQSLLGGLL
jgi:hypothetical protein